MFKSVVEKIESDPKLLFLIDGAGGILSAFLLGGVLPRFEEVFGIPSSTLYLLAIFPVFFVIYDFFCYQSSNTQLEAYLKIIATMNLLYCCLSIGLASYHLQAITKLGWSYLLLEVLIVAGLAIFEWKTGSKQPG